MFVQRKKKKERIGYIEKIVCYYHRPLNTEGSNR